MPRLEKHAAEQVSDDALKIVDELEEDIFFGRLPPGTSLREEKLMERFHVSRHLIRTALGQLEAKQIIVREMNRGAKVRMMDTEEVRDLHEVREMLQRQAALRIPLPVPTSEIAKVEVIQAEYEACVAAKDLRGIYISNEKFHDAFYALCGNRQLQAIIRQLLHISSLIRARSLADMADRMQAVSEHRMMLSLLRGTDRWALAELCVVHIRPRRDAYLDFLSEQKGPRRRNRLPLSASSDNSTK